MPTRFRSIARQLGYLLVLSTVSSHTHAQQVAGQETDPVYLFNEICYTQIPDVAKFDDMATRFAWEPMGGEDLERFSSVKTPTLLKGWDFLLEERIYRIGLVQSAPRDSFIETFPDFADAVATSCTVVLDGNDSAETIFERMNVLVGKEPASKDVSDGDLLTTTWSGGNDTVIVLVFLKTDVAGSANLMNVTLITAD